MGTCGAPTHTITAHNDDNNGGGSKIGQKWSPVMLQILL